MATLIELRDDAFSASQEAHSRMWREVQLRHQHYVEDFRVEVR